MDGDRQTSDVAHASGQPALNTMLPTYPWLSTSRCVGADILKTAWRPLIEELLADADAVLQETEAKMELLQVKEKRASLRFYQRLHSASADQEAAIVSLIDRAYAASFATCIICGAKGTMRNAGGLLETVCLHHSQRARDVIDPSSIRERVEWPGPS